MHITDAEVAVRAAEAGAAVLRAKYGTALSRFDKSATDFATDADIEAEKAIQHVLLASRPDDGFIGEELGATGPTSASRTWLVDPLCGTLNYAAQTPLAAVNVALRGNDAFIAAASADPFAGEVFWTDGEKGYVRRNGNDEALMPSAHTRIVDVDTGGPAIARLLTTPEFADFFEPRILSTSLALAWVAAGRRAAYVTESEPRDSVHFASGIALCQAAGCVVTGLHGQPLYTGGGGLIAAADKATHAALVTLTRDGREVERRA